MPNQPKTKASTYRLDDTTIGLMDRLAEQLASNSGLRANRTDVLRVAVRELAAKHGVQTLEKTPRKKG